MYRKKLWNPIHFEYLIFYTYSDRLEEEKRSIQRKESDPLEELSQQALMQNLKDAGCGRELIRKFMELPETREEELINLLTAHREKLLQKIHKEERQITCLDYLIYQIKHRKA